MTNWLDEAIAWLSPQAGLKRVRARKLAEALSYEGSRSARRTGGWSTANNSGNAEIGTAGSKLRANARDLVRNNSYGRKAKREWAKRVVGYGIKPRPATGSKGLNKKILAAWDQWVNQCCSDSRINFYAAQQMIVANCYEAGEVLIRVWDRRIEDNLVVPLQIQLLEADYLDDTKTQTLKNGYIIQGVEFDPLGRLRGYWLYSSHPGEVITTSIKGFMTSGFVPAQYILHHAELDRPGDVRAVSRYHAVIAKLRDLDEYADAKLVRAKIEACLAAMVTQPEGTEGPTLGSAAIDATTGLKVEEFRPGMVMYGAPGADVKFVDPTSTNDYSAYKKTELREVAAGLEIPYVVLDDNLEAVNYSSYRGGLLAFRDAIEAYRWNWLIPQVLNPIWQRFIDKLFVLGTIPEPNYAVQWDPPPFDLLDRKVEAEADRLELQIGKKTWPQLIGEQGSDAEIQVKEIENWKSRLEAAGVTFAASTSDSGAAAAGEKPSETNPDKSKPDMEPEPDMMPEQVMDPKDTEE